MATRSAPVIWVPHLMNAGRGHSRGGGRPGQKDPGRKDPGRPPLTIDQNTSTKSPNGFKVFIVDYKRGANAICCALMFTLVQIAIGGLNMGAFIYSLSVGDLHTILCCSAFHLFSAEGIMAMSYKNGWSLLMGFENRIMCHTILQILGVIMAITGITVKLVETGVTSSGHCISGIVTASIGVLTLIFGPVGLFKKSKILKSIHLLLGLATFVCASICFTFSIFMDKFKDWCKHNSSVVQIIMPILLWYICLVMAILVICKLTNVDMLRASRRQVN